MAIICKHSNGDTLKGSALYLLVVAGIVCYYRALIGTGIYILPCGIEGIAVELHIAIGQCGGVRKIFSVNTTLAGSDEMIAIGEDGQGARVVRTTAQIG